jgi:hypothetical protein
MTKKWHHHDPTGVQLKITLYLLAYLHTWNYLLTQSMEQSPSWEANRFSNSHEIPSNLWNPKVHYRIHKCPPPVLHFGGLWMVRSMIRFYDEELLTPRPTPKLKDHPLSPVHHCLLSIFAATLHIGDCSSIRDLTENNIMFTMSADYQF